MTTKAHATSRTLAVVPARGGSKGLADKIIHSLAGIPLLAVAWSGPAG